ncbi:MAG: L-carnitine dehydrogenase [Halieaceae bacterium]|nr:L-carnitine dehydrogenase [Halieaceae bacterium]
MTRHSDKIAVIGAGVIGAGWAARALAHGLEVIAWDIAANWQTGLRDAVENAWPALIRLGLYPGASLERLHFASSLEEACAKAGHVQECAPERLDLKRELFAEIDAVTAPHVVIASSTSGLLPSEFQVNCQNPERVVVGHPFNPVYLLPLVEVLGGRRTSEASIDHAIAFYTRLGMHPLRVRKEVAGFLSDRLQEALWREILHLVNDDVATTEELDAAIIYGPGLRWAFMGTCLSYHLAGGDQGMATFLQQFGPALKLPWTKLQAPELSPELIDKITAGTQQQAAGRSVKELEQLRDNCLIAIMQALRHYQAGAGRVLAGHEARLDNCLGAEQDSETSGF